LPAVCIRRKRDCAFRHRRLYEFLPFFAVPAALPGAYCGHYSPNGNRQAATCGKTTSMLTIPSAIYSTASPWWRFSSSPSSAGGTSV